MGSVATMVCPGATEVRSAVDAAWEDFFTVQGRAAARDGLPGEVVGTLRGFLDSGGKRVRPVLCVAGWHAGGGAGLPGAVVRTAASLELFHAFALIHDDVMDDSDTRRGRPTAHRVFAAFHRDGRDRDSADRVGGSAAILLGDLALAWSDALVHTAGLAPARLAEVLPMLDAMRTEIMYGQYLDVTAAGRPIADVGLAWRIVRYKTARYTLHWPLRIGAALAGAPPAVVGALSAYARPLGEAFQLRDDLLGVFGSPARTGKSRLDDLRDGKHTVLIALALQRVGASQQRTLRAFLGRPDLDEDGAACLRQIIMATGARDTVERCIRDRRRQALDVLDRAPFPPAVTATLRQFADTVTMRTS